MSEPILGSIDLRTSQGAFHGSRHALLRKGLTGLPGFLLMGATLAPVAQYWNPTPKDNFPFSYYTMFSEKRSDTYVVSYLVGLDGRGNRHTISYSFAGSGGLNQTRRQINRLIREGKADTLCRSVASAVAKEVATPYSDIVTVQIVTARFRFADYFAGNKTPMTEQVHASCRIARGERTTEVGP